MSYSLYTCTHSTQARASPFHARPAATNTPSMDPTAPMHHIQIDRCTRTQRESIRLGAGRENTIVAQTMLWWRLNVERDEVATHWIEEVVGCGVWTKAHGFEVPEGVVEVAG